MPVGTMCEEKLSGSADAVGTSVEIVLPANDFTESLLSSGHRYEG